MSAVTLGPDPTPGGPRRSSLSQRSDGKLVLIGRGHSDSGPFNFEVTKEK